MFGTGFLLKFNIEDKLFFCLMTNEHVINEKIIESKKAIEFLFDLEKEKRTIILDKKQRIIKDFKDLDITV
jgi:hypothetical protein